jgi:FlaA1/EpsC-like NDP-sugar epimerase
MFVWNKVTRVFLLCLLYGAVLAASLYVAFQLRFDFYPAHYMDRFRSGLVISLGLTLPLLWLFGQFRSLLSYFGLPDAQKILAATSLANLGLLAINYFNLGILSPPRGVVVINFVFVTIGLIGARLSIRILRERFQEKAPYGRPKKRLAVYGAGSAGAALVEELMARPNLRMQVCAIFDDDKRKAQTRIHGVPILGDLTNLRKGAAELNLDEVILAMPTADPIRTRAVVAQCRRLNIPVRTIPTLHHVVNGHLHLDRIKPVEFEDLLARESVEIEGPAISGWITGRKILVTGAGGTIGAELARQVWGCHPKSLILIERSEPALFEIEQELKEDGAGSEVQSIVADVGEEKRMETIFGQQKPDLVLHAAAHKHVPLMEQQVGEALTNNSLKTVGLARIAAKYGTREFVMISTDKAINPTNVMGASKRLAEIGLQVLQKQTSGMKIISVRFGNVLGSSGSVIPTFRKQIAAGGPVTVTHPEVTRYFMSVAEAVGLVLTAAKSGQGGEIFVLDMGKPVKIEEMARQLIELSGFEVGREIEIRYTGLRPGEKLYEELSHNEETNENTEHPKIWKLKPNSSSQHEESDFKRSLDSIIEEAAKGNISQAKQRIKELVPEYQPWLG